MEKHKNNLHIVNSCRVAELVLSLLQKEIYFEELKETAENEGNRDPHITRW